MPRRWKSPPRTRRWTRRKATRKRRTRKKARQTRWTRSSSLRLPEGRALVPAFVISMRRFFALMLIAVPAWAQPLSTVQLQAGMHLIRAEVAADFSTRAQGLMHRKSLGQNDGMLFVFDEAAIHCMWMKNTLIPLSVAFLDERGAIINIADMRPHSEQSHCAAQPARYALEMNRGWLAQRGIKPGVQLGGLERPR